MGWELLRWAGIQTYDRLGPGASTRRLHRLRRLRDTTARAIEDELRRRVDQQPQPTPRAAQPKRRPLKDGPVALPAYHAPKVAAAHRLLLLPSEAGPKYCPLQSLLRRREDLPPHPGGTQSPQQFQGLQPGCSLGSVKTSLNSQIGGVALLHYARGKTQGPYAETLRAEHCTKQSRSDMTAHTTLDTGRCSHSTCSLVVLVAFTPTGPGLTYGCISVLGRLE